MTVTPPFSQVTETIEVVIHLFAALRDRAGTGQLSLGLPPGSTAGDLKKRLAAAYPELAPLLSGVRVAVALVYVPDSFVIPFDQSPEIALIPPVSGG